jgi:hypothetical protein
VGTSTKKGNLGMAQGRPRDPLIDQAILRAPLELFIEQGIAGATIEKIALDQLRVVGCRAYQSRHQLLDFRPG